MRPRYGTREWFEYMFSSESEDRWGHQWRASQSFRYDIYINILSPLLAKQRKIKILDIGCGLCDLALKIYELNPENDIYGMDISEKAIFFASKKYPNFILKKGELPTIPFEDASFDLIICSEVLYYLKKKSREDALKNIRDKLNENGYFFFSTPLGRGYFEETEAVNLISKYFKIEKIEYNYGRLYRLFERSILKIINFTTELSSMLNRGANLITTGGSSHAFLLKLINFIKENPNIVNKVLLVCDFINRFLKITLSKKSLVKICHGLSKFLLRNRGKTQIIILARKI